jgi:hypothetical protein
MVEFLEVLQSQASRSTFMLFERLAKAPPLDRVVDAVQYALECARSNPAISDNAPEQALRYDEYASLCELDLLGLSPKHAAVAAHLLSLAERASTLSFLRNVFVHYAAQPYLADMDAVYQPKQGNT